MPQTSPNQAGRKTNLGNKPCLRVQNVLYLWARAHLCMHMLQILGKNKILSMVVICPAVIAHFHNITFLHNLLPFPTPVNKLTDKDSTDHRIVFIWLMRNTGRSSAWNQTMPFQDVLHIEVVLSSFCISISGHILVCKTADPQNTIYSTAWQTWQWDYSGHVPILKYSYLLHFTIYKNTTRADCLVLIN